MTDWTPLTAGTSYGNPAQTYGPYMQAIPVNPMNGNSVVVNGTVATGQSAAPNGFTASGFVYDYNSGNGTGLIYGTDSTGTTIAGGISNSVFIAY